MPEGDDQASSSNAVETLPFTFELTSKSERHPLLASTLSSEMLP